METPLHVPVLTDEIVAALAPVIRSVWVDCTLGAAGHARALLNATPPTARLIAFEVDPAAIAAATDRLSTFKDRIRLINANFSQIAEVLREAGHHQVDAIIADLGISSDQLADPQRGLSFERDDPLDMRLDPALPTTAADLVNGMPESELANLLYFEAQEHHSRKIARRIREARRESRIRTTGHLARVVASAVGGRRGKLHPATKTFLALRIAVNRETDVLSALLDAAPRLLRPGGRLAIISFHSGEDRRVKEQFRRGAKDGIYQQLTRRPIVPGDAEVSRNTRSRSAKLRIVERTGSLPTDLQDTHSRTHPAV